MRRIRLAVVLAISLLVPVAAEAQPAGKFPRIGYLVLSPLADPPSSERAAFLDGLELIPPGLTDAMSWMPGSPGQPPPAQTGGHILAGVARKPEEGTRAFPLA